jgi:N-acetylglucosaminyl-diphospho-decaprenol L-rhamnosyltransferase
MVGIVVVTYNSEEVINECLEACLRFAGVRIVVVDNHSEDATVKEVSRHPGVQVIANRANLGFAAAVNQGIAILDTRFVLLLNPDAVIVSGLDDLIEAVGEAGVGAAGGRLINGNGSTQTGFNIRAFPTAWTLSFEALGFNRLWPGNPVNRRYRPFVAELEPQDVDQPAGAFLIVQKAAWELVGGFDERFHPVWFEDVDFCKRLHQKGMRIVYVPSAIARHRGGHSADTISWSSRQLYWYGSLLRYAAKHFSTPSRRNVSLAIAIACIPRAIAGVLIHRTMAPVTVYSKVMWLAGKNLFANQAGDLGAPHRAFTGPAVDSQAVEKHVQH